MFSLVDSVNLAYSVKKISSQILPSQVLERRLSSGHLQFEPTLHIEPDSYICRSCRNDVKDIRNKQLIPGWRKTNKGIAQSCFVRMYPKITKLANKFTLLNFFSIEENENINPQHSDAESKGVSLCT